MTAPIDCQCTFCWAQPGAACVENGSPITTFHSARIFLAADINNIAGGSRSASITDEQFDRAVLRSGLV